MTKMINSLRARAIKMQRVNNNNTTALCCCRCSFAEVTIVVGNKLVTHNYLMLCKNKFDLCRAFVCYSFGGSGAIRRRLTVLSRSNVAANSKRTLARCR